MNKAVALFVGVLFSTIPLCLAQHQHNQPTIQVSTDGMAINGTVRLLSLSPDTGEDISVRSLSPGTKVAIYYAPPINKHTYSLQSI